MILEKKEDKVINLEREYENLVSKINGEIEATDDRALLEMYKNDLLHLTVSKIDLDTFKTLTSSDRFMDAKSRRRYFDILFQAFNKINFAGFDYYYSRDLGEKLAKSDRIDSKSHSFDVYINEEHLNKLKNTTDTTEAMRFISYVGEDDQDRYAIWLKGSPVFINLIPFKRLDNKVVIGDNDYKIYSETKDYNELSYRTVERKNRVK